MKITTLTYASLATLAGGLLSVQAQNLNGTVNTAFYGSPAAVQTINTGFGNAGGGADSSGGSELDAVYGNISSGNLYLFLAGNFENNGNHLNVFIAGGASGQSTLSAATGTGGTLGNMNGSSFSPGFSGTFALDINNFEGTIYSEEYNLSAGTGGYVGALAESATGIAAGSDGGIANLYLNNNHASTMGVSGGALSGATSGSATTTGLEIVLPLSGIGYAGGSIKVLADINGGGDGYLSNQFLSGLPVGYGNLGNGGVFNFGSTPGQFATIAPVPEPTTLALSGLSALALLGLRRRK